MRLIRSLSLVGFMTLVTGCSTLDFVSFGASGISYLVSGKSLSDHFVSAIKKQDCAMHRAMKGEKTCIPMISPTEMLAHIDIPQLNAPSPIQTNSPLDGDDFTTEQIVAINVQSDPAKVIESKLILGTRHIHTVE